MLLFHAGIFLLRLRLRIFSLVHKVVQWILVLANGTIHNIYVVRLAIITGTYLWHHLALIHLMIVILVLGILSLKIAVLTATLTHIAAYSHTLGSIQTKDKRVWI